MAQDVLFNTQMNPANRLRCRLNESVQYRLRALGRWKKLASYCRPVSPLILLTERCNARCVHCDIWKNRGKEDSPTLEQWKTLVEDLRRWLGPVQVVFTGGEALLKPFAPDLVAHASSLGLFVEHLTHGYWDDQSRVEKLALAKPWRITVSFDGLGETHSRIRGREKFFERTAETLRTLQRVRKEHNLGFAIRLKTVIMEHNLNDVCQVAHFAQQGGMHVFYQPIEQNYNTPEDAQWFQSSPNWPRDTARAAAVVQELIELKRRGLPIANSYKQLQVMIPYFHNPDALRVSTQSHRAHEHRAFCDALGMLQVQANGDVTVCTKRGPVGNIKDTPIRYIWEGRPAWWREGCCLESRYSAGEKAALDLVSPAG